MMAKPRDFAGIAHSCGLGMNVQEAIGVPRGSEKF